jgi:serine-type D-Ala-D-Ala carboxypeptidase/endopeptidase (penicillin-binding protein 4)
MLLAASVAAVLAALLAALVATHGTSTAAGPSPAATTAARTSEVPPPSTSPAPPGTAPTGTPPTGTPPTGTAPPISAAAPPDDGVLRAASDDLRALGAALLADPRVGGFEVGLSVWDLIADQELLAVGDRRRLLPASIQKLATAAAVLEHLEADFHFETRVSATGGIESTGTVQDLVLVAGGDPTLGRWGPHSLDALAEAVATAGVQRVSGEVVVDTSRWSEERAGPGWLDWQQPRFVGWMSAMLADGNQWQLGTDAADPAAANGRTFAGMLAARGIVVDGGVRVLHHAAGRVEADGVEVAVVRSAPRDDLVTTMLQASDNLVAEAFVRELGWRASGEGSAVAGGAVVSATVAELVGTTADTRGGALEDGTVDADGSGLSRHDRRSAAGWRALLVAADRRPWWPVLTEALPVAGRSGTLVGRLSGPATAGQVSAKTGTTVPVRALGGVLTAPDGRRWAFVVLVNGTDDRPPVGAEAAIDTLVTGLVTVPAP